MEVEEEIKGQGVIFVDGSEDDLDVSDADGSQDDQDGESDGSDSSDRPDSKGSKTKSSASSDDDDGSGDGKLTVRSNPKKLVKGATVVQAYGRPFDEEDDKGVEAL